MKKLKIFIILFVVIFIILICFKYIKNQNRIVYQKPQSILIKESNMQIRSLVFENNQFIPKKYTCDGENINPPLEFKNVPKEAKSLVLIVDDPDAPFRTFTHWIVWNIDPRTTLIDEGKIPSGAIEGINDFGKNSYGGPCPPSGIHHYYFKLYALDKKLDISEKSKKKDLEDAMKGHIIDYTELIGLYKR